MSKVPSTRLKMSEHGDYLAVGASDGTVSLIKASTFKTVSLALFMCYVCCVLCVVFSFFSIFSVFMLNHWVKDIAWMVLIFLFLIYILSLSIEYSQFVHLFPFRSLFQHVTIFLQRVLDLPPLQQLENQVQFGMLGPGSINWFYLLSPARLNVSG